MAASSGVSLLVLFLLILDFSVGKKIHTVHWNSSNPMFRIDNTDNVIDINVSNTKFEYDQANIVCPHYKGGTSVEKEKNEEEQKEEVENEEEEKYIIYNVSKEEYETCRIMSPNPRIIAVCDQPHELKFFTITFRSFTPTPGGLEFRPGNDYYFISTSSPKDLRRKIGGRCSTHNMKVIFKVAPQQQQQQQQPIRQKFPPRAVISSPRSVVKSHHRHRSRQPYEEKNILEDEPAVKKIRSYQKTPVFKQEASRMPSSSTRTISTTGLFLVMSLLIVKFI